MILRESYDSGRALAASELISLFLGSIDINVNMILPAWENCSRFDGFLETYHMEAAELFLIHILQLYQTSPFFHQSTYHPLSVRLSACAQM